jgi:pyruvate/2-oxoacid:ferredoxin oxidoreductase beta subunit
VTVKIKERKHVREYLKHQKRFSHLDDKTIDEIDRMVEANPIPTFLEMKDL